MAFFKKKVTVNEFAELLLSVREKIERNIVHDIQNEFDYTEDKTDLEFEASIFSLWIMTVALPQSERLRDLLHEKFCEELGLDRDDKTTFYSEINKRYSNYYAAFNIWQENHKSGDMMGTVIVEIIKNQNPDFSVERGPIPLIRGKMRDVHK